MREGSTQVGLRRKRKDASGDPFNYNLPCHKGPRCVRCYRVFASALYPELTCRSWPTTSQRSWAFRWRQLGSER